MNQVYATKTRLVIAGSQFQNEAIALLLYILNFLGKEIDCITAKKTLLKNNDFILFQAQNHVLNDYHPNITLITEIDNKEIYQQYIETVVGGGIVIFNEENSALNHIVKNSTNFFRKIPYRSPEIEISGEKIYLKTDLGEIPLKINSTAKISYLEGIKHFTQHLGIMESEFYESLIDYPF